MAAATIDRLRSIVSLVVVRMRSVGVTPGAIPRHPHESARRMIVGAPPHPSPALTPRPAAADQITAAMPSAANHPDGLNPRAMIVVPWRAGLPAGAAVALVAPKPP
ncbi:MAG TPA: hypothetical protein VFI54_24305 [Solirubrobacteraceae bacterium]|nr:hypothetical protein [Solirubrobacteraceae bacterium]